MDEQTEVRMDLTTDEIDERRQRAMDLKDSYLARDAMFDALEMMYHMEWSTKLDDPALKKTINPDAHNAVENAVRLLTSTEPVWRVTADDKKMASQLEDAAQTMWVQSGKQRRKAPHRDMVRSAILYDEIHVAISSLTEWAKMLEGSQQKRVENAAQKTPFSYEVWNPHQGYAMFDALGLCGYYREVEQTVKEAIAAHGNKVKEILTDKTVTDTVTLGLWYDLDCFILWVDEACVWSETWELPFLPIDVTVVSGSSLWEEGQESREPLLKAAWKSGHWENTNLAQTVWYTDMAKYGMGPMYVEEHTLNEPQDEDGVELDYARGIVHVPYGIKFSPMDRTRLVNDQVIDGMALSERKLEESTLYKTAAGQSLGKNASFSMTALLSQAGRLPLVQTKEQTGEAIANIMDVSLRWYKELGEDCPGLKLKPGDVPDNFELTVNLEIDLPQDKLQNANTAIMLVDKGMMSKRQAQEEFLQITDSEAMKKEIWSEQAADVLNDLQVKQHVQKEVQQQQAQAQAQQQGNMNPNGAQMARRPQIPAQQAAMMNARQMQQGRNMGNGQMMGQGMRNASAQPMPGGGMPVRGMPQAMRGMVPQAGPGQMVPGQQAPNGGKLPPMK